MTGGDGEWLGHIGNKAKLGKDEGISVDKLSCLGQITTSDGQALNEVPVS